MVCPAYHSAFILDEEDQRAFFSNFSEDSSGQVAIKDNLKKFMEKNKYGIVVEVERKKKMKLMDYIPRELAFHMMDSTLLDSTGTMELPGYNRDQVVYNRKFGNLLAKQEERWKKIEEYKKAQAEAEKAKKEKKSKNEDEDEEEWSEEDDLWLDSDDDSGWN